MISEGASILPLGHVGKVRGYTGGGGRRQEIGGWGGEHESREGVKSTYCGDRGFLTRPGSSGGLPEMGNWSIGGGGEVTLGLKGTHEMSCRSA